MAIAYITEYAELATDVKGNVIQAGKEPALAFNQEVQRKEGFFAQI